VIVKLLQASDIHEEDDVGLPMYHNLVELSNSENVDIALLLGDYFGEQDLRLAKQHQQKIAQEIQNLLPEEVHHDITLHSIIEEQLGGLERAKSLLDSPEAPPEAKKQLVEYIEQYEARKDHIPASLAQVKKHEPTIQKYNEVMTADISNKAAQRYVRLDKVVAKFNAEVLGTRGNWELDPIYGMKNIHFVEKKPVTHKGLSFAAAPNWYEALANIPKELYQLAEHDPVSPQQMVEFIAQHGSEEDVNTYINNVKAGDKLGVPESVKALLPVYRRLKGVKADILLTHKGPGWMATQGDKDYGSGMGLEMIMEEMKPKIVLGGHIHGRGLSSDEEVWHGVRSSDHRVYITHVDNQTKIIEQIDVYHWKGDDIQRAA